MIKHYVRLYYPGIFFAETIDKEIDKRVINKNIVPDNCYGFMFYDKEATMVQGEMLTGKGKNKSCTYYIGNIYTIDEVRELYHSDGSLDTLLRNMENNCLKYIVKTRCGNWVSFNENDIVIEKDFTD